MPVNTLYYIHDPMCSWCWGFRPALDSLLEQLPDDLEVRRLLGGLAPDSDQPMPEPMQRMLQQTWQRIEAHVPGVSFNHDFWRLNQPRRSTWPACRAVIAVRRQRPEQELAMIDAIQQAYYRQARNPSETQTLVSLAEQLGCDKTRFTDDLHSEALRQALDSERAMAMQLGVQGFPSLVLVDSSRRVHPIPVDYHAPERMRDAIQAVIAA